MRPVSLLLLLVVACATVTPPPPSPPRKTNFGLRMIPATLPNGLRVVLVADPNASEVQVTMRYQVGANDDPVGQEGTAHLVEHLMFQQSMGGQSLFAKLEDVTTSFSASTGFDATTYSSRAAPARLTELLSIEAVRLGLRCTSITESAFEREREVVLNELRLREPATELLLAIHHALYPDGHPYRRSDSVDSVGPITLEQACAFADAHYAPSNAVLVVSGPITVEEANEALDKFVAKIVAREGKAPTKVPPVPATFRRIDAKAPIDKTAIVLAWPLPQDPATRLMVVTAASRIIAAIETRGLAAESAPIGDAAARMYGVVVGIADDESRTHDELLSEIRAAVASAPESFRITKPEWLANAAFDRLKQSAIYGVFSNHEEGSGRDETIAATVLAGGDPNAALAAQSAALGRVSGVELERLAKTHLRYEQATVAVLTPSDSIKRGTTTKLVAPVHDIGQRRDPPDPEEAWRAADEIPQPRHVIAKMRKRTLANGLDVVLLPVTSVPTVEIRLVFGSGTADDSSVQRGAARAAAKALEWNWRYLNDLILFAAGGGTQTVDVGLHHTTFTARGVDMHIDLLLAGLRRWVRDGIYKHKAIEAVRDAANRASVDRTFLDTWRAALFGASHPYAHEYIVSGALTLDAVKAYRKDHYTPDNATLVIAGRFDADLADRWIDYLFADWKGTAKTSRTTRTVAEPASIANDDAVSQVAVAIAIPATRGTRAEQLVGAAMLDVIVKDIRHQLGASYAIDAGLDEERLASTYLIGGWIAAPRVRDAFEHIRVRLAALRADPDTAARTFVTARRRVIVNLLRSTSSAYQLAERVQSDIELGREPLSDARTAEAVRRLTLESMPGVLAQLDLSRAVIVLRGPHDTLDDAFAALDRTPRRITGIRDHDDPMSSKGSQPDDDEDISLSDIEEPVTQNLGTWTLGAFVGFTTARALDHGVDGFSYAADLGYRVRRRLAAGVHVSHASLDGSYEPRILGDDPLRVGVTATRLAGFLQFGTYNHRQWGSILVGPSFVSVTDNGMTSADVGIFLGLHGGYDVANFSGHRFSVYGRIDADLGSSTYVAGFTFGAGYRFR